MLRYSEVMASSKENDVILPQCCNLSPLGFSFFSFFFGCWPSKLNDVIIYWEGHYTPLYFEQKGIDSNILMFKLSYIKTLRLGQLHLYNMLLCLKK